MTTHARPGHRDKVLRVLAESPVPLPVATIAERLSLHPNTVRFHLDRLVSSGQVERTTADRGVPGRPAQLFRRVHSMDSGAPTRYRVLADVLVDQLAHTRNPARHALDAGRAWGAREAQRMPVTDPVEGLTDMLDDIGFTPSPVDADGTRIAVHSCPFLELAQRDPDVVCAIHLGLMQGALAQWGSDVTVTHLDRFHAPTQCIAHLARRTTPAA